MPRLARPFLNGVIVLGLVIAVWPLGQTLYGRWNQRSLAAQWQAEAKAPNGRRLAESRLVQHNPDSPTPAIKRNHGKIAPWPLTKFTIPNIELETYVVQGMDAAALRRGPGHDPYSATPGSGNCVIAGHRNIYGSFFYRLDELLPGAPITLENRKGKWTYLVTETFSTTDTDLSVLQPPAKGKPPILTLITCTLPHSNYRIITRAELQAKAE